jgi:PIN domain nuclease of toxin-antitoxin system
VTWVLDASAVLALLRDELGADRVAEVLAEHGAIISPVNAIEVVRRLRRDGHPGEVCERALDELPIFHAPFTREMGRHAARLEGPVEGAPLSLADRACIAAAIELDGPLLTADRAWLDLDLPVRVESIR